MRGRACAILALTRGIGSLRAGIGRPGAAAAIPERFIYADRAWAARGGHRGSGDTYLGVTTVTVSTERASLRRFVREQGIKFDAAWVAERPDGLDDERASAANHYRCLIRAGGRRMTVHYSMGSAWTAEPELEDVLYSLALDASGFESAGGFEDWCGEYGYDTDSRRAERTWRSVERQSQALKRVLGESGYRRLLWEVERL